VIENRGNTDEPLAGVNRRDHLNISASNLLGVNSSVDPRRKLVTGLTLLIIACRSDGFALPSSLGTLVGEIAATNECLDMSALRPVASYSPPEAIRVSSDVAAVRITLNAAANHAILDAITAKRSVILRIVGIQYDTNPGAGYEIYIGPIHARELQQSSLAYLGTLHFYGLKQAAAQTGRPAEVSFDMTGTARRLVETHKWNGTQVEVTFVRRPPTPTSPSEIHPEVRISSIEICID
jgi:hypothetical protein